ncbi:MAG: FAD-binding protein [Gordonibacter pamelaeae]|uniref:FAD-dependent oxidoreductase n=1 Tax=Gordonibacter TaxID=644652 RepID=UPI001D078A99|nr:FAD-binding protein [Gordonibacter pamelaeae]HJH73798.1 FAD-binding protein [Eggerthellaceae bacterium]MBS4894333.1 FAD-binding protein [Gordonibacter pamelaeae]MCB6310998.1 FAD-binding protein [Gordonibacter pamelaeae]MCQ4845892.1 FAD-binding protein [Gordonibacter pamelaeae]MCQ4848909.1 FAD-binding protein [Gordonibacter pamelaeae]
MSNERSGLSRRSFLKGAGITALGAAAAGALAGCGNGYAVDAAAAPANARVGEAGTPSWLGLAPEVPEADIVETLDVEVLVVGCRTGGLPAIISAAENGARVLGIDRVSKVANPREDIGAIDSALQKASFAEYSQFEIDKMEAVEDIVRYANGFINYDLVKLWANESGPMLDWITGIVERDGRMVMNFEGSIGTTGQGARDKAWATGHSPAKTALSKDDKSFSFGVSLMEYAQEKGAEFRWNTELVKCEQDGSGRVTGVIARDVNDRHYLRINASKGVILSTGGYGNNLEMMEARQPWNQALRIAAPGKGGNPTGDGIKAALWAGGQMDPLGAACTFNRACCKPDQTAGNGTVGEWFWFGEQPFMKVNLNGNRFCNESGPYDYMLHSAYMQPHHTYCDIWDANYAEQVRQMNEVGCCRLYPFDNGAPSNRTIESMASEFEKLIEAGYIQQADTMEELAEKLNIPVENTVKSWQRYNHLAEQGRDEDYNKEAYRLMKLDTPPFYGVRTGAWFLATLDGVMIDTDMHPVREDGTPVEGLYLTGDCSGGFFSVSYPNLFTGLACGRTMTFGRRAGMLAATGQA